jgi:DNA-binding transcriptional LysR family regulator
MARPENIEHFPKAAVFAEGVRAGSFGHAAAALAMSRSTVSHHVSALEAALGVRLLERTTRRMRLTQEGTLLYERVAVALAAWSEAAGAVAQSRGEPTGTLRVTAPSGLSSVVARAAGAFLRAHPGVGVEVVTDDQALDLVSRGIDVAIRLATLKDSTLVATKLGATPLVLVASPALAASFASSRRSIDDVLGSAGYVAHATLARDHVELARGGDWRRFAVRLRATANSAESQLALVEAGAGVTLVPALLARESIQAGRLVRMFADWSGRQRPIYAVQPARRLVPPRVSLFLPHLKAQLDDMARPRRR